MQLRPHEHSRFVTVSDERDGDSLRHFVGILLEPDPPVGEMVWLQVNVTDNDNGFGWPVGVTVQQLKNLGNNIFGS